MTSIIILTHNQLDYTMVCLNSIYEYTKEEPYEIIVVDNASTDGTVEWLKKQRLLKRKNFHVIFNKENMGFPKGCNQGIEIARGDEILLLNNDTIVTKEWLRNLKIALYSDARIGAVGPLTNTSSYYQKIAVSYDSIESMHQFAAEYNAVSNPAAWEERLKLVGFCLLIKKSVIEKIGVLDEIFSPGNFEDDDYCFRMIQANYRMLLCRDVFIHHFGSVSFKEKPKEAALLYRRNALKFKDKWGFDSFYCTICRNDLIDMMALDSRELSVLEVGCACGATLLKIRCLNPQAELHGIELSEKPAEFAAHFASVENTDIETSALPYRQGQFDYILFGDVLEHLYDPLGALLRLKPYLKVGGAIVASVPNVMNIGVVEQLLRGEWTYKDSGIQDRTHLCFFTADGLKKLLIDAGFDLVKGKIISCQWNESQEKLLSKISEMKNVKDRKEFTSYQYIVKAVKREEDHNMAEQAVSEENVSAKTRLKFLLRRIEHKICLEESLQLLFQLTEREKLDIQRDFIPILKRDIYHTSATVISVAEYFYRNSLKKQALLLLIEIYGESPKDADVLYALAHMLYEENDLHTARGLLENFAEKTLPIQQLLEKVREKL